MALRVAKAHGLARAGPRSALRAALPGPLRTSRVTRQVTVSAAGREEAAAFEIGKLASLSAVASSWAFAGNAQAASELATLAASDNRLSTIALLFLPVVGWVGFNILQPAFNQLSRMTEKLDEPAPKKKRGIAGAVGLGAALSLAAAQQADAATEIAQLAASDNRLSTIALLFLPVVGWVGFNILQPAFNQLNRMNEKLEDSAVPARRR